MPCFGASPFFFLMLENSIYTDKIRNKAIINFVKYFNFPLRRGDSLMMLNGTQKQG